MKTSKRLLSLLMAVVMALTAFSVGFVAFAEEVNPETKELYSEKNASKEGSYNALTELVNEFLPDILEVIGKEKLENAGISIDKIKDADFSGSGISGIMSDRFYELMVELTPAVYNLLGGLPVTSRDAVLKDANIDIDPVLAEALYQYLDKDGAAVDFWSLYANCLKNADSSAKEGTYEKLCADYLKELAGLFDPALAGWKKFPDLKDDDGNKIDIDVETYFGNLRTDFTTGENDDGFFKVLDLAFGDSEATIEQKIKNSNINVAVYDKSYADLYAYLEYYVKLAGKDVEIKTLSQALFYMLEFTGDSNKSTPSSRNSMSVLMAGVHNKLAADGGYDFSKIYYDFDGDDEEEEYTIEGGLSYSNWYAEMSKILGTTNYADCAKAYIRLFDPDANLNITDSPCLAAIEKTLKDRYGINSAGDFESYKIYSGLENKNAPYAYAYQKNYLGDAYDDANYPIDLTKYGMQLVNDTINGYVGMLENLSDILPDGIDLDVDAILQSLARVEGPNGEKLSLDYLVNILKDIYVKLAKDPVGTIANLLPLLAVLLDEVLVPLLFNQSGDAYAEDSQGLNTSLLIALIPAIKEMGINSLCFDLNTIIPTLLDYIQGTDNNEHYEGLTVVVGEKDGVEITREVPIIFNVEPLDKLIAQYLYNYAFVDAIGVAVGDDNTTAIIADIIKNIIPKLDKAIETYLSEHKDDVVLTSDKDIAGRGLNNITVALPTVIDILGKTILNDLGVKDDWQYANRIAYTNGEYRVKVGGDDKNPVYEYYPCRVVSNETLETLKLFMFDKKQDPSNVTGWIVEFLISDMMNGAVDFINAITSSENTITKNIPIITSVLNVLGGFTDLSVITDVLNGFFGLTRTSKYSFTFAERAIPCSQDKDAAYVGLSEESAYYLIANIGSAVRAFIDMAKAPEENPEVAAIAPYSAAAANNATLKDGTLTIDMPDFEKVLTEENLKASNELIATVDSLISALLENTYIDGFKADQVDGILSGVVTFVSNLIGKPATEDLMGLLQRYILVINAENTNQSGNYNGNADGTVNAKKVYSEKNLSILVTETYAVIEEIVNSLLGGALSGDAGTIVANAVNGIVSPGAVVSHSDNIDKDLLGYFSWKEVSGSKYAKNLGYTFNAGDREAFFANLYDSLGAVSSVFGALFCTTGFYNNVFAPIFNSINEKCGINPIAAKAANGEEVLLEFTKGFAGYVNMLLAKPATTLLSTVSGVSAVLVDRKLKPIVAGVLNPVVNELKGVAAVLNLLSPKLGAMITGDPTLGIVLNLPPTINALPDLANTAIEMLLGALEGSIGMAIKLPKFDWAAIAALTPAELLLKVYTVAVETILSEDIFKLILGDNYDSVVGTINKIGKFNAASILDAIRSLLAITNSPTEAYWTFDHYLGKANSNFTYPTGITSTDAENAVDALDALVANVFPLLQQFGVLQQGSLNELLSGMLFTNGTLTTIAKALYGAIDGALGESLASAGIDISSPAAVGAMLTAPGYSNSYKNAAKALEKAKTWDDVKELNWGFTDGSAKAQQGFINGIAAMLRPVQPVLTILLGEDSFNINDILPVLTQLELNLELSEGVTLSLKNGVLKITALISVTETSEPNTVSIDLATALASMKQLAIYGANGYESAIIPLLEALMCDGVKTFEQYVADYKKDLDNVLIDILNPIFGFVNKLAAAPVDTLTAVLPNLAYFIDNNGIAQVVDNLLAPVTQTILPELKKNGFDVDKIIINFLGNDLGGLLTEALGVDVELDVTLTNLKACNIQDIILPLVTPLIANLGITLPEFKWSTIASHGEEKTVPSAARNSDGDFTTVRIVANQGETLVAVLRYVETLLVKNASAIQSLLDGLLKDADATVKNIVASVFNNIKLAQRDEIVKAVFYLLMQEQSNAFFDYTGFKFKDYDFVYPETIDMEFLNVLAPMIDGILTGVLNQFVPGGLSGLLTGNLYTDSIVSSLATGLYGAVEGVMIDEGSNLNLTQLLAMTGIDFSTDNLAELLTNKDYGQTYDAVAKVLASAGSWKNVKADKLVWGVKDRDSFLHALTAALRPLFGVLDVLLNDGSLGLFNLIFIPGSDGYTSTIVPLMEAFGLYNIKTQYQYREDISKEYDAILLDILNPLIDKVEDILNAPIQMLADILPNLALFFANDGLLQLIENLLLPISALLEALEPIVNVNALLPALGLDIEAELAKIGIKGVKFDIYNLAETLKPIIGSENILGVVNNILKSNNIKIELMPIDWYQLASHGTVVTNEPSQVATHGARVYVESDRNEVLVAVLRYLINTINYKDNLALIADLVTGLMGENADPTISDVVGQVLGMLEGETDVVLSDLCGLLQTFA